MPSLRVFVGVGAVVVHGQDAEHMHDCLWDHLAHEEAETHSAPSTGSAPLLCHVDWNALTVVQGRVGQGRKRLQDPVARRTIYI